MKRDLFMKRKLLAMLLAVVMVGTLFGGGKSDKDSQDDDSDGKMVLNVFSHFSDKHTDDQEVRKLIEEKLNITLDTYQTLEKEVLNIKLTSNEIPDFFWGISMAEYHKYIDQGLLAEIPIEMIKTHAPDLAAWAEKNGGEQVWGYYNSNGKNYAIPELWTLAVNGKVLGYRESILQDVGISEAPETLEEFETLLAAIKEQKGIYPIMSENNVKGLSFLYGAFDNYLTYYEKDGKMIYGPIEDESFEAVTKLNDWYSKGYIDPEFVITDFDNVIEKWGKDDVAITEFFWWEFLPKEAFFDGRLYEINETKGSPECIVAFPPTGHNGARGITQGNAVVGGGVVFGEHMEDQPEKMAAYLKFFDNSFDREMMDLVSYGVEGETYNYNDETGVEWIPPYDQPETREEFGISLYGYPGSFNDYDLQAKYMTQLAYLDLRIESEEKGIGSGGVLDPFYRPVFNQKTEVLDKIFTNAHMDFITGERPLDEWDDFVAEWLAAGGDEVLVEAQELYDANLK